MRRTEPRHSLVNYRCHFFLGPLSHAVFFGAVAKRDDRIVDSEPGAVTKVNRLPTVPPRLDKMQQNLVP